MASSDTSQHEARSVLMLAGAVCATLILAPLTSQAQICIEGPCGINLVGTSSGGVPDPHGEFKIKLGVGPTCIPLANTDVQLQFVQCEPDIQLCSFQTGATVGCPIVFTSTDANGEINLSLVGGANNTMGAAPGYSGLPCDNGCVTITVAAFGVIGHLSVGAFDQNSSGGVNPVDISLWLTDAFAGPYFARSDYDFSKEIRPPDLALLLSVSLAGKSSNSCTLYCL